jgi:nitrite reductase/ring-hydroxylating ferredoxin subunit
MSSAKYNWRKVFNSESEIRLPENKIAVIDIAGKSICITNFNGQWFAFAHSCPHAGAPLDQGCIDSKGNVVCPVHNYKFSIANGKFANFEGFHLKTYPVELRPDGVFIGVRKEGLLSWF